MGNYSAPGAQGVIGSTLPTQPTLSGASALARILGRAADAALLPTPPSPDEPQPLVAQAAPPLVVARQGHLFQLQGVPGWLSAHDFGPCRACGGFRFAVSRRGLSCSRCLKPRPGEKILGIIDLPSEPAELEIAQVAAKPGGIT
jgi:hypothetical protein